MCTATTTTTTMRYQFPHDNHYHRRMVTKPPECPWIGIGIPGVVSGEGGVAARPSPAARAGDATT